MSGFGRKRNNPPTSEAFIKDLADETIRSSANLEDICDKIGANLSPKGIRQLVVCLDDSLKTWRDRKIGPLSRLGLNTVLPGVIHRDDAVRNLEQVLDELRVHGYEAENIRQTQAMSRLLNESGLLRLAGQICHPTLERGIEYLQGEAVGDHVRLTRCVVTEQSITALYKNLKALQEKGVIRKEIELLPQEQFEARFYKDPMAQFRASCVFGLRAYARATGHNIPLSMGPEASSRPADIGGFIQGSYWPDPVEHDLGLELVISLSAFSVNAPEILASSSSSSNP